MLNPQRSNGNGLWVQSVTQSSSGVTLGTIDAPTLSNAVGAGSIADGFYYWQITNTGGVAGTVGGVAFPAGASIQSVTPFFDPIALTFRLPDGIAYDATGTNFLIETVAY